MLTREEAEKIGKQMELPQTGAGLLARFASDTEFDRMEINIFSISGRALTLADILTGLSHFNAELVRAKTAGENELDWDIKTPPNPTSSPAPLTSAQIWGG